MAVSLKDFRSLLRELSWISQSSILPGQFQVLDIFCYIADKTFLNSLTPAYYDEQKRNIFLFDIVITDGIDKLKCFLAMDLGQYVVKHLLKIGDFITIDKVKLCYLEGEFGDNHIVTYVLLEAIQIISTPQITFPPLAQIQYLDSHNPREHECRPLVTGRKYYIHIWNPSFVYGQICSDFSSLLLDPDEPPPINFQSLGDFDDNWRRLPQPYGALLVRVLSRGKLHQYGNNKTDRPFPIVGYLLIGDATSTSVLVIFNKIAIGSHYGVLPGTILLIENYKLQDRRQSVLPPFPGNLAIRAFNPSPVEIALNDLSRIRIVPEDCPLYTAEITTLPQCELAFAERSSLQYIAPGTKVDIVGLITCASSYYRVLYKLGTYLMGIWLEMVDSSSFLPFRIFIWIDPNRVPLKRLRPGKIIACTQMKVFHALENEAATRDEGIFLNSSVTSEIYVDLNSPQFIQNEVVRKVAHMIRDNPEEIEFLRSNVFRSGSFHYFSKLSRDVTDHDEPNEAIERTNRKLLPGAFWKPAFEDLTYREKKRVILGGYIFEVAFIDFQTVSCPENQSAYGWSYASNVRSRRILYHNLQISRDVRRAQMVNVNHYNKFMFPMKYSSQLEEEFHQYLNFPVMNADDWTPPPGGDLDSVPVNVDGFYVINVVSFHYQALIQCVLVPQPAKRPPTFVELLCGNYEPLPIRQLRSFVGEPPRYTSSELKRVSRTAHEVAGRTFICLVDFYRQEADVKQAILYRAFICPPDTQLLEG